MPGKNTLKPKCKTCHQAPELRFLFKKTGFGVFTVDFSTFAKS